MLVNGEETTLNIWEMRDTENTVETEWSIPSVDFVVLCFSLTDRTSYDRVTETVSFFSFVFCFIFLSIFFML